LMLTVITLALVWWYVVIHQQAKQAALPPELVPLGGAPVQSAQPGETGPPANFYLWFAIATALMALVVVRQFWRMDAAKLEVIKLLPTSILPLGILTVVVLVVILVGITTATESAAIGAIGAFLLAIQARTLDWKRTKEAVFLTAKTTAMVCWLFVGSA